MGLNIVRCKGIVGLVLLFKRVGIGLVLIRFFIGITVPDRTGTFSRWLVVLDYWEVKITGGSSWFWSSPKGCLISRMNTGKSCWSSGRSVGRASPSWEGQRLFATLVIHVVAQFQKSSQHSYNCRSSRLPPRLACCFWFQPELEPVSRKVDLYRLEQASGKIMQRSSWLL